ncbi:uncharacterized protein F4822DRAFT_409692 [Hypoxylon trugodes]|uniref:uncharacterized protein n=1 Tax=Hypoxylon trugodes TaxID=326681 RepID=UPI00219AC139|nr:uncharacterized protein F4822DRAFT_409692 [Hypoxylon trugodes]KAI1386338.1 hypothetical protein F4822DRAFT_409692 [Hypoxylon trugodes]
MALQGRRRSSSLSSSSPLRNTNSDWLVSSTPPVSLNHSQSQPPPIRQRSSRKMSPAGRASTERQQQHQPSQKRTSSLTGFFRNILPSNRPEQGGTRRTKDQTNEINGNDVELDVGELTDWNLAKEKNPAYPTTSAIFSEQPHPHHHRGWSWSPQKGDSRFVENLPRDRSHGREQEPDIQDLELPPPRKSDTLARAEVHELFKTKEESRRNRKSLKESGDWLGVQGADPYSGQFSVLTPTDTPSSETTSASTRSKLAGLARRKKAAKLEYEQIRLLEEQEKDKARLDREQAKLNKIERVKEELRRQHQFARWSQHRRHWSSAAEPNLSPIAQSIDSVALGSSETSSLLFSDMPTDSFSSGVEDPTSNIRNFSRPTRPPVSSKISMLGQAERLSCDSTRSRGHKRFDLSTDTIIHNAPDANSEPVPLTRPASQPSGVYLNSVQPDIGRAKSERHFLWRRRRETDPGKSAAAPHAGVVMSMAAQNRTTNSIEQIQKDHFADLAIPDYRLHLLSPEPADVAGSRSTLSEESPLTTPYHRPLGSLGGNRMALSSTTNLNRLQGNSVPSQGVNVVTAAPSQSKLKGIIKRQSIRRRLVPSLLTTNHAKGTERRQISPPTFDELQDQTVNHFPGDTPGYPSQHLQPDLQGRISLERAGRKSPHIDSHVRPSRRGSVSIPITITTGCGPGQQDQLGSPQPKWDTEPNQMDGATDIRDAPMTPASIHQHEPCIALEPYPIQEEHRTPSPPITLQNGSPNHDLGQEIPETDIISTYPTTPEKKPPTRVSTPTTPRLSRIVQQNAESRDADASKDSADIAEKTEADKTPKAEHKELRRTSGQEGRVRKLDQERHNIGAVRTPSTASSQEAQPHLSYEDQRETIVEEAARIAVLRSKAKEIVRSKSVDRRRSRSSDNRTLSPPRKQISHSNVNGNSSINGNKTLELKHSLQQRRPKKKRQSEEGVGIGLPSELESIGKSTNTIAQVQQHEKGATEDAGADRSDVNFTVVQFCKTVYIVFLGVACTWWIMVRPAFDQRSELWRRKHRKESTWQDVAVFASAGGFCIAGAAGIWYLLRLLWWVVKQ